MVSQKILEMVLLNGKSLQLPDPKSPLSISELIGNTFGQFVPIGLDVHGILCLVVYSLCPGRIGKIAQDAFGYVNEVIGRVHFIFSATKHLPDQLLVMGLFPN
jgi:hypothetical protein